MANILILDNDIIHYKIFLSFCNKFNNFFLQNFILRFDFFYLTSLKLKRFFSFECQIRKSIQLANLYLR